MMRVWYCRGCGKVSGRRVNFDGVWQVWCEDEACSNAKYAITRDEKLAALQPYVDQASVDAKFDSTRQAQLDTILKKYEYEWSSEYTGKVVARSLVEGILRNEDECSSAELSQGLQKSL